jgi:hypothetical protein
MAAQRGNDFMQMHRFAILELAVLTLIEIITIGV